MSLSTQLIRLARNVGALTADTNAIFEALRAKGVDVPANAQLSDVADMIEEIEVPITSVEIGGRSYPVVRIGNQYWLAENLDWKFDVNGSQIPIGSGGVPTTPAAWYYSNNEAAYGIDGTYKCGLLYNWYAAKYLDDNKATLLPSRWRVATNDDWTTLIAYVGGETVAGTKLKASNVSWAASWNGTDDYGFGILPAGSYNGDFYEAGYSAYCRNVTELNSNYSYTQYFNDGSQVFNGSNLKSNAGSLRLVRTIS